MEAPLLPLRLRPVSVHIDKEVEIEDLGEEIAILRKQAARYAKSPYLSKRTRNASPSVDEDNEDEVDSYCREQMIDWCYRVCDHFRAPRCVVAYASSFCDRFAAKRPCNRTDFKLASMTSLLVATKLFNSKQLSVQSLAELSRGEFELEEIAAMERLMLQTLEWRMNPPTAQDFIRILCKVLPQSESLSSILQYAIFFAELSVYDASLMTKDTFHHAVACVLCAMDVDENENRDGFVSSLCLDLELKVNEVLLETLQIRLWYLFSCSAQPEEEPILARDHMEKHVHQRATLNSSCLSQSPVSVQEMR